MRFIDADAEVTVLVYDAEHEENSVKKMTLEEMCEAYTEEGCPIIISELMENKWIPCSEERTEKGKDVLISVDFGDGWIGIVDIAHMCYELADSEYWFRNDEVSYQMNEVIAWMPLPEPYSE